MRGLLLVVLTALVPQALWAAAKVDPSLVRFSQGAEGATVRVIALMDLPKSGTIPRRYDRGNVFRYLVTQARNSWTAIEQQINSQPQLRGQVKVEAVHYINNSFVADVTPAGLKGLANAQGISKIYKNGKIDTYKPVARRGARPPRNRVTEGDAYPYDLVAMGIDQLRKANPNANGAGVLVGHIDTGVDGKHPALAGKIALFYDPVKKKVTEPYETGEHGTHTAGTVVGGQNGGVDIGVAPGAKLISSAGLQGYDHMLNSMEFMLDPDKNPNTPDFPRLVTNSWNCGGAPDIELFYRAISAWEAAGILPVFSAGNSGPNPATITPPHEHPDAFAVAATGPNGKVADFSSRGPGKFQGKDTQKPDVSAPGVDIVSSVPGGKFEAMSGTSMATPHVAGLVALILQANPALTPIQVRQLVMQSLTYVDINGNKINAPAWNAAYGFGHVNALKAIQGARGIRNNQETRWGFTFQPSRAFMLDAASMVQPASSPLAESLVEDFATDDSRWIDGALL